MLVILMPSVVHGQNADRDSVNTVTTLHEKRKIMNLIAPGILILGGTGLMLDKDADESFLSNFEIREERNEHFLNFSTAIDDYLQHAPSAVAIIMSLSGVKGRHDLPNQIALLVKSELLMLSVVMPLKYTVGESRPDSGSKNSFPSGHTAQAFVAAAFLAKEYGHKSIWIPIGSYTVASTVGVFRMLNNRHWISDVLVGAGVGLLSSEVVFRTHRNKWGHMKWALSNMKLRPFSSFGSQGMSLTYKL